MENEQLTFTRILVGVMAAAIGTFGFLQGWNGLKKFRQPTPKEDALVHWDEYPLSMWQEDPLSAIYIVWQAASVIILFTLMVPGVMFPRVPLFGNLTAIIPGVGGVVVVAYLSGVVLSFPFARRAHRPVLTQLTPEGVVYGTHLWNWKQFSHYQADPNSHLVRLYSARSPQIGINTWQPADGNLYTQITSTIGHYLPSVSPTDAPAWYLRRPLLLIFLFCFTLPLVIAGAVFFLVGSTWGPLFDSVAAVFDMVASVRLLHFFGLA